MKSSYSHSRRTPWATYARWAMLAAIIGLTFLLVYLAGYNDGMMHERKEWLSVPKNPFGEHP